MASTGRGATSPPGTRPGGPSAPDIPSTLPRPLSIAMVAPCPFPTHQGTQVLIRHMATALARAGHEVHLITYGYGEYEEEFPFSVHRAVRIDAGLRSGPSLLKPAADAALVVTAARVVKAHRCDLLHVHNVEGLGLGAILKLQTSLPLVYHAHNAMGPELPTYYRAHIAQAFASMVGDVVDKVLPKVADAIITFDSDHKALHEAYGVAEERLHVIPPGLDGSEIRGAPRDVVDRMTAQLGPAPKVLYAGNPDAYQNLPLLWHGFQRARAKRPELELLVATNHPPEAFGGELRDPRLSEGVRFVRYASRDELRALFAIADIGVSPRALWAGAPIKILNYLAAGLPVVACRSGARHVLSDAAGILTDDDPAAFACAMLQVLDSRRMQARARRAFERFRIEAHVPLYEQVYQSLLGPRLTAG